MSFHALYNNNDVSQRAYAITNIQRKCDPTFIVILPYLQERSCFFGLSGLILAGQYLQLP